MSDFEIRLKVNRITPLAIADALIEYEIYGNIETKPIAIENLRQIGQALLNYVEADEKIEMWCQNAARFERETHE